MADTPDNEKTSMTVKRSLTFIKVVEKESDGLVNYELTWPDLRRGDKAALHANQNWFAWYLFSMQ